MKITILGCGAAPGVPSVSSGWGRCDPGNPKNRRRRASILVEEGDAAVLVDTSPDLREQLLGAGVKRLDAVLYTHDHADHTHGLDELREVNRLTRGPIAAYGTTETFQTLERRFGYAFEGIAPGKPIFRPWLTMNVIEPTAALEIGPLRVRAFAQDHGYGATVGYRFETPTGNFAYSTDLVGLPPESKAVIRGAKLWVVGALQDAPHPTHASLPQVLAWVEELKPHRAIITHMSNDLDYETMIQQRLPVGVTPAFDGMTVTL